MPQSTILLEIANPYVFCHFCVLSKKKQMESAFCRIKFTVDYLATSWHIKLRYWEHQVPAVSSGNHSDIEMLCSKLLLGKFGGVYFDPVAALGFRAFLFALTNTVVCIVVVCSAVETENWLTKACHRLRSNMLCGGKMYTKLIFFE
ncbi:hypothetical protein RJT34_15978 [Clitoria ternatea]|uniref:Uncharacterized protein n=1 Tax=Clitoria ternatea TaxID=43366 RepID=A0AAN9PD79_CLITE